MRTMLAMAPTRVGLSANRATPAAATSGANPARMTGQARADAPFGDQIVVEPGADHERDRQDRDEEQQQAPLRETANEPAQIARPTSPGGRHLYVRGKQGKRREAEDRGDRKGDAPIDAGLRERPAHPKG